MGDKGEGGVKNLKKWVTAFIGLQKCKAIFLIFRNPNKLYIIGNGDSLEDYVFISIGQLPDYWPF